MKFRNTPTYEEHLQNMFELSHLTPIDPDTSLFKSLAIDPFMRNSDIIFYVLDFLKNGFAHFDKNAIHVMGQPAEAFYEGGTEFTKWISNPNDWDMLNKYIFPDNHQFLSNGLKQEPSIYRITYNFRTKTNDGQWIWLLQQSSMIYSDQLKLPVASFGTLSNISDHKSNSKIVHRIEHLTDDGRRDPVLVKFYFHDLPEDALMTRTEIEILKWLADGHSSKQIAENISYIQQTGYLNSIISCLSWIPDAGHLPQWDNPARFNQLLEKFAQTIDIRP